MKFVQSWRLSALAGAATLGFVVPSLAHATCNGGSTLYGYYALQVSGETPTGVGKFLNGVVFFNGTCALQVNATIGENDTVNSFVTFLGTYGTNADGTISMSFNVPGAAAPEVYNVAYSPGFGEALGIETDSSAMATIDVTAQLYPASGNHYVYGNANLKGTFAVSCTGNGGVSTDQSLMTFDGSTAAAGSGKVSGVDYANYSGQNAVNPITGFYGVNSIGNFGGYLVVAGGSVGFSGVLSNDLNEIQYNLSTPGSTGYDFENCVGKRVK